MSPRRSSSPRGASLPHAGAHAAAVQPASVPSQRTAGAQARRRAPRIRAARRAPLLGAQRLLAIVLAAGFAAGLFYLVNGPSLRISSVAWAGAHYTSGDEVATILEPLRGTSLLTLDDRALASDLAGLPAVQSAQVQPTFPGGLSVELTEKSPALVWQTSAARLVVASDGIVFGEVALTAGLPAGLATLPFIDDRRLASRDIILGNRIPDAERTIALRLARLNPAALGSVAKGLVVRIEDGCGYVVSPRGGAAWAAAIGVYGPGTDATAAASRIDAQVTAVRTLFSTQREKTVGWVDARNPGKVYWRPNGPGGSDAC